MKRLDTVLLRCLVCVACQIFLKMAYTAKQVLLELWAYHATLIVILAPLLALPLPLVIEGTESRAAYVLIVMGVYWVTEALPLPVTALLPLVLFPLMGVMTAGSTAIVYLKDTNALFIGGLIVAVAIEHCNLHKRIALRVLLVVGSSVRWLMLGFMIPTAFLSMFISNTATTAMMTPIAQAVLSQLVKPSDSHDDEGDGTDNLAFVMDASKTEEQLEDQEGEQNTTIDSDVNTVDIHTKDEENAVPSVKANGDPKSTEISKKEAPQRIAFDDLSESDKKMSKALILCVAYAANIGGTATLIGTGTNLILTGVIEGRYGSKTGVDFASWFIYAFPGMVIFELFAWLWLQFWYLGCRGNCCTGCPCGKGGEGGAKAIIREQYRALGPMSWAEGSVLIHFTVLAILWMSRDISGYGWGNLFEDGYVSDATAAIFIAVLLFIFPAEKPNFLCCRRKCDKSPIGPRKALLDWKTVHHGLPWGIVLLLGGGFALAEGCQVSGLSQWIGDQLAVLDSLPAEVIILIATTTVCFFTEVTSNVAIATIFLPILGQLGESICVNPLYLMIPSTIVCSYAFMLPVATPPNAIVFSYGQLTVPDLVKVGFFMNIIGILLVNLFINTYGDVIFDVKTFPSWALAVNSTCLGNTTAT
ncbi:Na(+)/citrate cotransporter-like isoform X2 [Ptychodera flava]|uniref:Na(+)/citrate cotransporter-like isoform X2 n=1 Tax=Ptychodera flava TaxID=63121 RepID=UPI00396A5FD6